MDLVDRHGAGEVPQTAFVRNQVLCSNLRIVGVARAGGGSRLTAQAGRGRASAVSLKREEAEQADGASRGPKGAPQELGCLPDLTAQNNNEKTGQRIHNFEKIVKIKARGSAVYLVLAQFNGRLCGVLVSG